MINLQLVSETADSITLGYLNVGSTYKFYIDGKYVSGSLVRKATTVKFAKPAAGESHTYRAEEMKTGDTGEFTYPVVPVPPPPPPTTTFPRFGCSDGWNPLARSAADLAHELDEIKAAGGTCLRLDHSGANFDTVLAACKQRGLSILDIIYVNAPTGSTVGTLAHDEAVRFANEPAIIGIEIMNEPDLKGWQPDPYADFVKAAASQIRSAGWTRPIVAGALWKGGPGPAAFARALATRAKGSFDYLSLHLYDDALERGTWNIWDMAMPWAGGYYNGNTVREILDANGCANVPIISTEGGGPVPKYSETKQQTIVKNNLAQVTAGKIAASFIFSMWSWVGPGGDYGLLRPDKSRRPSWDAYKAGAV